MGYSGGMEINTIKLTLQKAINRYRAQYSNGLVSVAISKDENRLKAATITFTNNDSTREVTLDYDELLLLRVKTSVDETIKIIDKMIDESILEFNGFKLEFTGTFNIIELIPSTRSMGYITCEFPSLYANASIHLDRNLSVHPLAKLGLPLYPDGKKAVLDFLGMSGVNPEGQLIIQIPDYRARISKVIISGNRVTVNVESRIQHKLLVKFYADANESRDFTRYDLYRMTSEDVEVNQGIAEYDFDKRFDYVLVALINSETGEMIDYRGNDFGWSSDGVEVEMGEEGLRELISRGENLNVEFKKELSDEFLETVVAFCNTNGGIILLGVDDNCHVVGYNKTTPEQLTNLIEGNLDPKPKFTIKQWEIDRKPIITVDVDEGDNKPYVHREKGAYIRTSSNDRSPTRPDLDAFYTNRSSRSEFFPR